MISKECISCHRVMIAPEDLLHAHSLAQCRATVLAPMLLAVQGVCQHCTSRQPDLLRDPSDRKFKLPYSPLERFGWAKLTSSDTVAAAAGTDLHQVHIEATFYKQ